MKLIAAMVLLGVTGGTVYADPCAEPPKKRIPPPKRPNPPKRPEPPKPLPCECKGQKGDPGKDGEVRTIVEHRTDVVYRTEVVVLRADPAIRLGVGVMGTVQGPHGDWAWGPALQLSTQLKDNYRLAFSAGLAMGASDGRESGYLLELKASRVLRGKVSLFGGLHYTDIDGSQDNGNISGNYLGATAGLSYTKKRFELSVGPTLGGLRDDFETGTQLSLGLQGSLFVRI